MIRYILLAYVISMLFVLSCTSSRRPPQEQLSTEFNSGAQNRSTIQTKPSWEEQWDEALLKSKHEGKVVIIGSIAPRVRQALAEAFGEKFNTTIEVIPGSGAEVSERILRERRAGLYLEDIHIGGVVRVINQLFPSGAVDSLDSVLLLPEVTNPNLWWKNELPWIPGEKDHVFANLSAYVQEAIVINTKLVGTGEITSHRDMLNPKWKGKIIMNDSSVPSSASAWFNRVTDALGVDFMRQLARQDVMVLRNERLILDWLAQGKYAIGIGVKYENTLDYIEAGAPLNQIGTPETLWVTPGAGGLSLLNKAPHPYSAKLFVNWLLGKEGSTTYSIAAGEQSSRNDVATNHLRPNSVRQPGQKYMEDTIDSVKKRDEYMSLAREIFGTLK